MNGYIDTLEKVQFIKYIHTVWEERIAYKMNTIQKHIYEYIKNGDSEITITSVRQMGTTTFLETIAIAGSRLGYNVLFVTDSIYSEELRSHSNIKVHRSHSNIIGSRYDIILIDYVHYALAVDIKTITKHDSLIINTFHY